jgi:glycyl-tRNA synthetase
VNFKNVQTTTRKKPPFGIAQVGKSFRNEITPGNFIFRTREFEQMEMEYFVPPEQGEQWYEYWSQERFRWYLDHGIPGSMLRLRPHEPEELSHYSAGTVDVEFAYPWGWGELEGIANRTDFDLKAHSEASGEDLSFYDQEAEVRYLPHVIEPAAGADRATLAFLLAAYDEQDVPNGKGGTETRTVLHLHPRLAPIKVAVLPLSKNERLVPVADEVAGLLRPHLMIDVDVAGSIGRRYRRQDEVGTPLCVTVDFETIDDKAVTIRDRDTMEQARVPIAELRAELDDRLGL